jgi:hypothetical protein
MTQLIIQISDSSLIPANKKIFSTMKGVKVIEKETIYDPEFSKMIEVGENDIKNEKCKAIKTEDLWK